MKTSITLFYTSCISPIVTPLSPPVIQVRAFATKTKPDAKVSPTPLPSIRGKKGSKDKSTVVPVSSYINADIQKADILNAKQENNGKSGIYR